MSWIGLLVLLLFALLGHGYLWIGAINRLHGWAGPRILVDGFTLVCLLASGVIPLFIAAAWWWSEDPEHFLGTALWLQRAVTTYVWLAAAVGAYKLLERLLGVFPENDKRLLRSHTREPVAPNETIRREGLLGAYPRLLGFFPGNEVLCPTIDRKQLAIPNMTPEFAGLTIVHISDTHLTGRIHGQWYRFVAEQVNQLQADFIIITGDLIEDESCREWLNESLGTLQAPGGVYFILGNHDHYIDTERTIADLSKAGLTYLGGRAELVSWKGGSILFAGYEGPWGPHQPPIADALVGDTGSSLLKVVLLHTPDEISWACDLGADLVLAGHTHGGQVRLPLFGAVAAPSLYGTRYACGTFLRGTTAMHVTRGISGETPLRWNCPPEIAVLELVRADAP